MQEFFAGFDVGRTFHVLVVVDDLGKRVFKRQVANTFNTVQEAINRVQSIASGAEVYWAVEMVDRNARMLVETLVARGRLRRIVRRTANSKRPGRSPGRAMRLTRLRWPTCCGSGAVN